MEAIRDFTWMRNILDGKVERFSFRGFRTISVRLPSDSLHPQSSYRYRLLFFPPDSHNPVLSLNLEFSILGAPSLTEQYGPEHFTIADADEQMSFERFKEWALRRAEHELSP